MQVKQVGKSIKIIRSLWVVVALCLVAGSTAYAWQILASTPAQRQQLAQDNNAFAIAMYQKLGQSSKGNLFWSPYSVSSALAMTYTGAHKDTAKEMAKTLHFQLPGMALHASFAHQYNHFHRPTETKGYQLAIANRLWATKELPLLRTFSNTMMGYYGANVGLLKFNKQPEIARQKINKWVAKKTEEKIKVLLPKGSITPTTQLVLTNAIYFKGDWARQFKKKQTRKRSFWAEGKTEIKVPTMYAQDKYRYHRDKDAQILWLPYKRKELGMWVLLPRSKDGLAALEAKLSTALLTSWQKSAYERKVRVYLPRFRMRYKAKLKAPLQAMGMQQAFSQRNADFSKMTGKRHLMIDEIYHQAFVEVNEQGTEAAAATAVVMRRRGLPARPPLFRADRPFLFVIQDKTTDTILFMGRVTKP